MPLAKSCSLQLFQQHSCSRPAVPAAGAAAATSSAAWHISSRLFLQVPSQQRQQQGAHLQALAHSAAWQKRLACKQQALPASILTRTAAARSPPTSRSSQCSLAIKHLDKNGSGFDSTWNCRQAPIKIKRLPCSCCYPSAVPAGTLTRMATAARSQQAASSRHS